MGNNILEFNIPDGYQYECREIIMNVDNAVDLLSSKKQRKFYKAVRLNQDVTVKLYQNVFVCPYCGHALPATPKYIMDAFGYCRYRGVHYNVPKKIIEEWGSRQLTFLEPQYTLLHFNDRYEMRGKMTCPKCAKVSVPFSQFRNVIVETNSHYIRIKGEIIDLKELVSLPWITSATITISFPVYEVITFNLRTGKTYIELTGVDGMCVSKRDITSYPDVWEESVLYKLITENVVIKRTLKRAFKMFLGGDLPFYTGDLSPEKYVLMTRFIGYKRNFYDAIPYENGTYKIDAGFKKTARQLHTIDGAVSLYENSNLPNMKSVRKTVFDNPGILFYHKQIEELWEVFRDPNLLCRLLKDAKVYEILVAIYQHPIIIGFFKDYCSEKGAKGLIGFLLKNNSHGDGWRSILPYIMMYCSMNDRLKQMERTRWNKHASFDRRMDERRTSLSLPMHEPNLKIQNCTIDGFKFEWLRTNTEYYIAGRKLDNCLGSWMPNDSPVVVVKDGKKLVAAIEIREQKIVQLQGASNTSTDIIEGFPKAYEAWKKRFELEEDICSDDYWDDDD